MQQAFLPDKFQTGKQDTFSELHFFLGNFPVKRPKNGAIYIPITIFGITEINFDEILYISVGANVWRYIKLKTSKLSHLKTKINI